MNSKIGNILLHCKTGLDKLDANRYWKLAGMMCILSTTQIAFISLTIFLEEHQILQSIINQIFWAITMFVADLYLVIKLCKITIQKDGGQ